MTFLFVHLFYDSGKRYYLT